MQNVAATDQIKGQLHRAIDEMRDDFARIELLAAALEVFGQPVPDYEPEFHHLHRTSLSAHELREPHSRKTDH
jgi:hypothetical protein